MSDDGLPEIPHTEVPDPFDENTMKEIADIQKRSADSKQGLKAHVEPGGKSSGFDRETGRSLGVGLTVGYALIGMPMFGVIVGYIVDKSTGSRSWTPNLVLVGCVIGIVMTFVVVARQNRTK